MRFGPLWQLIAWGLTLAVVYVSVLPRLPDFSLGISFADKIGHWFAYFVLGFWYCSMQRRHYFLSTTLGLIAMGVMLEYAQLQGGHRYFDWWDALANGVGAVSGMLLAAGPVGNWLLGLERWLAPRGD